jgi:hypothetical protein
MATYERYSSIQSEFVDNDCILQSSFEEFVDESTKKSVQLCRFKFIGKCGHESSAVYTNFHNRKTGIYCKECIRNKSKEKPSDCKKYVNQEHNSINYLSGIVSDTFDVIRTNEGCSADMLIRHKLTTEDKWLRIQVKTTKGTSANMYGFQGISDKYKDMIIICHSMSDNKIWVFPFNECKLPKKLNISYKSKYNKYLCTDSNLPTQLLEYYTKYELVSERDGNYQNNKYQRREVLYPEKRMKHVPFLEYEKSDIQNTATDFHVANKKVQEKVIGSKQGDSYVFQLSCRNGKEKKRRTYKLGENDIYWFHSSFDELFWIIPESIMFTKGWISGLNEIKPCRHIKINPKSYKSHDWLKQFEFDYSNITEESIGKIKELFSIV